MCSVMTCDNAARGVNVEILRMKESQILTTRVLHAVERSFFPRFRVRMFTGGFTEMCEFASTVASVRFYFRPECDFFKEPRFSVPVIDHVLVVQFSFFFLRGGGRQRKVLLHTPSMHDDEEFPTIRNRAAAAA